MKCQRLNINWSRRGIFSPTSDKWHQFWCAECRAARSVDEVIAHGVAQMQAKPVPADGLSQTLAAVRWQRATEAQALSAARRGHALVSKRVMAIVLGALVVTFVLLSAFLHGRREGADAVLAQTLEALQEVKTFHIKEELSYSYSAVDNKVTSFSTSKGSVWFSIDHGLRTESENGNVAISTKNNFLNYDKSRDHWVRTKRRMEVEYLIKVRGRWVHVPKKEKSVPPPDPVAIARRYSGEETLRLLSELKSLSKDKLAPVITVEKYRGREARHVVLDCEKGQGLPYCGQPYWKTREEFWIDEKTHLVLAEVYSIEEADGKMRKISGFDDIEYNVKVDPRLFAPPPGATVVDE